jgi:hypothetical protein
MNRNTVLEPDTKHLPCISQGSDNFVICGAKIGNGAAMYSGVGQRGGVRSCRLGKRDCTVAAVATSDRVFAKQQAYKSSWKS